MTVALVTFGKSGVRKQFAIESGSTVIGRKIDADLRIPLAEISRAHCEVSVSGDEVTLRDLESSNGTFLNGEQIREHALKAGDHIKLGPITFTVQINGEPADISIQPAAPQAPPGPPAPKAAAEEVTQVGAKSPADTDDFDIDELDDLEAEDLEDIDIEELSDLDLEEVDELEELSEDDIIGDGKAS